MFSTLFKCFIIFITIVGISATDGKGCLHPGKKLHAKANMSREPDEDGVYPVGTNITYSCDSGFETLNNQIRQCLHDGTWSGREPYCGMNVGGSGEVLEIKPPNKDVVGKKLNDVFTDCNEKVLPTTTTTPTWVIRLNKSYRIDRIKVSLKVDDEKTFDVPDVIYSLANDSTSLNRRTNKSFDYIRPGAHTDLNKNLATFHYDNDSPFSSSIISLTVQWSDERLELCDIALYSSSATPEEWCGSDDDVHTKHLLYNDKCYVVIGNKNATKWTQAKPSCREYKGDHRSDLAKFSKDKSDILNYIHHSVMNTGLSNIYFWISHENELTHRCSCVKFPNIPQSTFELMMNFYIPVCGSPDQNNGTLMVLNERNATYSCPINFRLIGSASRFCSNGQWSPPAPTCECPQPQCPSCTCDTSPSVSTEGSLSTSGSTEGSPEPTYNVNKFCSSEPPCTSQNTLDYIIKTTCIVVSAIIGVQWLITAVIILRIKFY